MTLAKLWEHISCLHSRVCALEQSMLTALEYVLVQTLTQAGDDAVDFAVPVGYTAEAPQAVFFSVSGSTPEVYVSDYTVSGGIVTARLGGIEASNDGHLITAMFIRPKSLAP